MLFDTRHQLPLHGSVQMSHRHGAQTPDVERCQLKTCSAVTRKVVTEVQSVLSANGQPLRIRHQTLVRGGVTVSTSRKWRRQRSGKNDLFQLLAMFLHASADLDRGSAREGRRAERSRTEDRREGEGRTRTVHFPDMDEKSQRVLRVKSHRIAFSFNRSKLSQVEPTRTH